VISQADAATTKADPANPYRRKRREKLTEFQNGLDAEINETNRKLNDAATPETKAPLKIHYDALIAQKADLARMPNRGWKRVMNDWLTDGDVYSFHRYQMLAWTLVLGLFFIAKVWSKWELPTFDGTTLALLGITSGTYLGFKLQKSQ
jgi:hypothetical protein